MSASLCSYIPLLGLHGDEDGGGELVWAAVILMLVKNQDGRPGHSFHWPLPFCNLTQSTPSFLLSLCSSERYS
jgi:hypothetical protein